MTKSKNPRHQNQLHAINRCLTEAANHGLIDEVVWSALEEIRIDHRLTPYEALQLGLNEWIK